MGKLPERERKRDARSRSAYQSQSKKLNEPDLSARTSHCRMQTHYTFCVDSSLQIDENENTVGKESGIRSNTRYADVGNVHAEFLFVFLFAVIFFQVPHRSAPKAKRAVHPR